MNWAAWIQNAALGVLAASLVEFVERRPPEKGDWTQLAGVAGRWAAGGAMAAGYARLVPREHWGMRSGVAFAQLPVVLTLHETLGGGGDAAGWMAKFAVWGAVAGILVRFFGAGPGKDAESELVLRLPRRALGG